jgi:hypothetical protein
MVGSCLLNFLKIEKKFKNIIVSDRKKLNLTDSKKVDLFIKKNKPDVIINCAGLVGGIMANNNYPVQFLAENSNVNLYTMINLDIYNLMFTLNKDNFDKIEMHNMASNTLSSGSENKNVNEVNVLFLFKPFGADLGIKPKYMYVRVTEVCESNKN